jgi:hypothetical protein
VSVLPVQIAAVADYLVVLTVELQHLPVLLQLAVSEAKGITPLVAVEILLIDRRTLALPAAPVVVQADNQAHIRVGQPLLEFLKVVLVQLLTVLLTVQVEMAALPIRAAAVRQVLQVSFISHGI